MLNSSRVWIERLSVLACALVVLLVADMAMAYGRVQWGPRTVKPRSDGNSWNIELKLFLPRAPDFANMPVKFEFRPTVYYERAMVDGDKLIERKVPLHGREPIIKSVDIGFLDPSTATIQKRTRFSFKITRGHGFECGEYRVTLRDGRNGQIIGTPTNMILGGENEVIDRRSIVFTGEKKKKKKDDKKDESREAAGSEESDAAGQDESAGDQGDPEYASDAEDPDYTPDADKPQTIKEKPGGCGCRVGKSRGDVSSLLGFLALGALLAFRRQRR
jgi:MYXO-CTERM domain-containing protein